MAEFLKWLRPRRRSAAGEKADTAPPSPPAPRFAWLPERGADRYLGGVASGLADAIDVDPFVVRMGLAVGAVLFPVLVVLYALAWLLLRDERTHRSLLSDVRDPEGWPAPVGVAALGLGAVYLLPDLGPDGDSSLRLGAALFVVGVLLLTGRTRAAAGSTRSEASPAGDDAPAEGAAPPGVSGAGAAPPLAREPLPSWPWRPSRQPRPPRPRSHLGWLGLSALLLLVGIIAGVDQGWEGVKPGIAVSLCLLLVGAILVLAAWRGRARVLLPVGLVLLPFWLGFAVTDVPRYTGDGDEERVVARGDPFPRRIEHGYGNLTVDLRRVAFPAGSHRTLRVGLTAGRAEIDVPRDVHLDIHGDVGLGDVEVRDHWITDDSGPIWPGGVQLRVGEPMELCQQIVIGPEVPPMTEPRPLQPGDPGYPTHDVVPGELIFPGDPRYPTTTSTASTTTTTRLEYQSQVDGSKCTPRKSAKNPPELELVLDVGIGHVEVHRV